MICATRHTKTIRRLHRVLFLIIVLIAATSEPRRAEARPIVWMMPPPINNGQELRELFEEPAGWAQTRSRIDGLEYADHWLNSQFSDAELKAWFSELNSWGLQFGMEVGALKEWGKTGDAAFESDRKKWDRFLSLGARINMIAMDEPFAASRRMNMPPEYAVEQTAQFILRVRQTYPQIAIGDIEAYPGIPLQESLAFVDALQARLRALSVRGLDFVRLDVDWMHFRTGDSKGQAGWNGVRQFEDQVHHRGLPFSLIYWAANYPALSKQGQATDATWTQGVTYEGQSFAAVGGLPDDYTIESWVEGPSHAVPEGQPGTFTRSVLDFSQQFLKGMRTR